MSIRKSVFTLGLAALATTFIACSDDSSDGDPTAPADDIPAVTPGGDSTSVNGDPAAVNDSTKTTDSTNTNTLFRVRSATCP